MASAYEIFPTSKRVPVVGIEGEGESECMRRLITSVPASRTTAARSAPTYP